MPAFKTTVEHQHRLPRRQAARAGRVVAADRSMQPCTLETVGLYDFGGKLMGAMTAHPKLDPETGEMLFFGYAPFPPYLQYHVADRGGALTRSEVIDVEWPSMIHDFAITKDYVVFLLCPDRLQLRGARRAAAASSPWKPERGTRIGVMPRSGGNADVRWFDDRLLLRLPPDERLRGRRRARPRRRPLRAAPVHEPAGGARSRLARQERRAAASLADRPATAAASRPSPSTIAMASSRASTSAGSAASIASATWRRTGPDGNTDRAARLDRGPQVRSRARHHRRRGSSAGATASASRSSCRAVPTRRKTTATCSSCTTTRTANASEFYVLDARNIGGEPIARDPYPAPRALWVPRQLGGGNRVNAVRTREEEPACVSD